MADLRDALAPSLDPTERRRMLVDWNATAVTFPALGHLPERLADLAARAPQASAVVDGAERLTYGELSAEANRLAHHLGSLGVRWGARVGVCLERSPAKAVAHAGVVAAGAAVVLLDPAQPADRLGFMLEHSGAAAVVTREGLLHAFPARRPPVICLDRDHEAIAARAPASPPVSLSAEDLAYVAYTSGSTGEPKAILLPHRAVDHCVDSMRQALGLTGCERLAWLSGPGYGIFIAEVLPYLASGAEVHVVDPDSAAAPERLRDWLAAGTVTDAVCVAPLAERLLALPWPARVSLRRLVVFGDRLRRWPDAQLPFDLVILYGSGEATCVSCTRDGRGPGIDLRSVPAEERAEAVPPAGRPLPNVRTYVLDAAMAPVPPGVTGELYVAGNGLALGYLDRPDLTREAFLPNPLPEEPGPVLYRTGDQARYRPNGVLEVLGRADQMVKVRGFRVELGEIEAALVRLPGVRQAVVVAREDADGDRRLVAYVVPEGDPPPTTPELRRALQARLPAYMVPAAWVRLQALPLNAHGKVDRVALPPPPPERPELDTPYEAPRGEVEEELAAIFSEVTGVAPIGAHDSFFELGGDSLLAIKLQARVLASLGAELTLPEFFEAPTVAQAAGVVLRELLRRASA